MNVEAIRRDFPILSRVINGHPLIYFDNAATTQKPWQVIESVRRFYGEYNANVHRAIHTLSYEATAKYEEAHKKVAKFIGSENWREIIFTRNATESINLVAQSLGIWELSEKDEVILTVMEHHSNMVPWQEMSKIKKFKIRYADVTDEGRLDTEHLLSLINERTKVLAISHASNVNGVINSLEDIIRKAKSLNDSILVLVESAQALPHIPVDIKNLGCDFFVASGHKMLGPTGIGFLWGKSAHLERMRPFLYGGDMISSVTLEGASWNDLPWKFEAGTPNISGGIGLSEAISYLESIGMANIFNHEKTLLEYFLSKLMEMEDVFEIYGPKDANQRLGIISFNLKKLHPHDVADFLSRYGIAVRSGHHCAQPFMMRLGMDNAIRVSFYIYNTKEEIDIFFNVIKKIVRSLS